MSSELKRVAGVDLTRLDGIKVLTVQSIITEAGLDMSKWATENHFVSWIGFSPRHDLSGGKILKKQTRQVVSRLATALRIAATTQREIDGAKLARLVYRMLKYGQEYVDEGTTDCSFLCPIQLRKTLLEHQSLTEFLESVDDGHPGRAALSRDKQGRSENPWPTRTQESVRHTVRARP